MTNGDDSSALSTPTRIEVCVSFVLFFFFFYHVVVHSKATLIFPKVVAARKLYFVLLMYLLFCVVQNAGENKGYYRMLVSWFRRSCCME